MRFLLLLLLPIFSFAQNGLVTIKLGGSPLSSIAWNVNGNSIVDSNFLGTTNSKDLIFKTKNTEAMRIDTNGNVGIGTATPGYKFNVFEGSDTTGEFIVDRDLIQSTLYNSTDDIQCTFTQSITGQSYTLNDAQSSYYLSFDISNTGAGRPKITLESSGVSNSTNLNIDTNGVGIGINSVTPTAKLHVNGTTRLEGTPQSTTSDSLLTIDADGNVAWRTAYYYGEDTLTNGVDTVWTSDVTDNSVILLTSNGLNGTSQTGNLDVPAISAGNYFVVNSLKANTTIETGDQRKYYWFFIRKP